MKVHSFIQSKFSFAAVVRAISGCIIKPDTCHNFLLGPFSALLLRHPVSLLLKLKLKLKLKCHIAVKSTWRSRHGWIAHLLLTLHPEVQTLPFLVMRHIMCAIFMLGLFFSILLCTM